MVSVNVKLIFLLAMVAVAVGSAEAKPKGKPNKKACDGVCTAIYDPVCAQDVSVKGSRPRSFASECVMGVHNCENDAHMQVLYKGECKGSGGIRLS